MKKNNQRDPLLYGLIGVLIGGVVVWFLAANAFNTQNIGMMRMMGMSGNSLNMMQSTGNIDAHFIEQMIPHHEDAITMSELALEKATRPEVTQLAQEIIDSQGKEIQQMKSWYKDWFRKEVPEDEGVMGQHGMMGGNSLPGTSLRQVSHMGMMGNETDLTKLENATDFDRAFVEDMIPHHQMAVMMASMLENGTKRTEMAQLADDIITAQTNEIDQMRNWLKSW